MKLNNILGISLVIAAICLINLPSYADLAEDAKMQYNQGIEYYKVGTYDKAAECFKNATELDPNFIDAYFNLGSLMEYLKNDEAKNSEIPIKQRCICR